MFIPAQLDNLFHQVCGTSLSASSLEQLREILCTEDIRLVVLWAEHGGQGGSKFSVGEALWEDLGDTSIFEAAGHIKLVGEARNLTGKKISHYCHLQRYER